jgi:hypothetical protein
MELIIIWVICAVIGAMVNGPMGAVMGFLLGPIGLIIAIFQSKESE